MLYKHESLEQLNPSKGSHITGFNLEKEAKDLHSWVTHEIKLKFCIFNFFSKKRFEEYPLYSTARPKAFQDTALLALILLWRRHNMPYYNLNPLFCFLFNIRRSNRKIVHPALKNFSVSFCFPSEAGRSQKRKAASAGFLCFLKVSLSHNLCTHKSTV